MIRKYRLAVFVDGDLWHGNEHRRRGLPSIADLFPNRTEWWVAKIERNIARDEEVNALLADQGWRVLRLWESDIRSDPALAADHVIEVLAEQRARYASPRTNC